MEINTVTKNYNERNEFCSYQVTYTNSNIIKSVPNDSSNIDYQAIQQWIADGGTVIDNPPE
jgi:hypothetical protein